MTKYTTKPQTVEAMQWLGAEDPAHVAEFEKWVEGLGGSVCFSTHWSRRNKPEVYFLGARSTSVIMPKEFWCVWSEDGPLCMHPDSFPARYTPVTVEDKS